MWEAGIRIFKMPKQASGHITLTPVYLCGHLKPLAPDGCMGHLVGGPPQVRIASLTHFPPRQLMPMALFMWDGKVANTSVWMAPLGRSFQRMSLALVTKLNR